MNENNFKIVSFYEFKNIQTKYLTYKTILKETCAKNNLRGTVILSKEGINGTLSGFEISINNFLSKLKNLNFHNTEIKFSYSKTLPFYKLKIKIKKEIVPFLESVKNPNKTGKFIDPKNWNNILNDSSIHVIDVRNEYETKIGKFQNSKDPKTNNFTEFIEYINTDLADKKNETIAMYCTGGIRCEKASAYMIQNGFKNVLQLKGGILKYLEETDSKSSLWEDECYVFDNRVSVKKDLSEGSYELCNGCKETITKQDKKSDKYEEGVSCPGCYDKRSKDQKKKSRERQKQINLFREKKRPYSYDKLNTHDYKNFIDKQ